MPCIDPANFSSVVPDRKGVLSKVAAFENFDIRPICKGLGSGLASCYWEAALTAREASQQKQAGKWQDLAPATLRIHATRTAYGRRVSATLAFIQRPVIKCSTSLTLSALAHSGRAVLLGYPLHLSSRPCSPSSRSSSCIRATRMQNCSRLET